MSEITNSPSANSGSWTNPTYAYADDTNSASSIQNHQTHDYSGYGFNLTGYSITKVEIGFEAWTDGDDGIGIQVSWDGGIGWSTEQEFPSIGTSHPADPTWYDVTSLTTWTPTLLNDTNFRVRVWQEKAAGQDTTYLDWLPVRVTYVAVTTQEFYPVSDARFLKVEEDTTLSDARFKRTQSDSTTSDARFKTTQEDTIYSDAKFKKVVEDTIYSDAKFKLIGEFTKPSDAYFIRYLNGKVDSLYIYGIELSASDVLALYQLCAGAKQIQTTSDARFKSTVGLDIYSNAQFRRTEEDTIDSNTRFRRTESLTPLSDARFKGTETDTIYSDVRFEGTYSIQTNSDVRFIISYDFTKLSDSIFKRSEILESLSDARFERTESLTPLSDARFKRTEDLSPLSDARFLGTVDFQKLSDVRVKRIEEFTKLSDARFFGVQETVIYSDAKFLSIGTNFITTFSDARFKGTNEYTRPSDAKFVYALNTYEIYTNSDARFKATQGEAVYSDARFETTQTDTIYSDARFKTTEEDIIYSDARFRRVESLTPLSDAIFKGTYQETIYSDARYKSTYYIETNSDAVFVVTLYIETNSDTRFKRTDSISTTSDAMFGAQYLEIYSNARFFKTQSMMSTSDALFVTTANLRAMYDMETVEEGLLQDLSGYDNDGTGYGSITFGSIGGPCGNATLFDGTDDYVDLGNDSSITDLDAFSITVWVKPTALTAEFNPIIESSSPLTSPYGLYVMNDGRVAMRLRLPTEHLKYFGYVGAVRVGLWTHIAITFDGTNWECYINTIRQTPQVQAGTLTSTSSSIVIGRR